MKLRDTELLYTTFTCLGTVARTCLEIIPVDFGETEHSYAFSECLSELDQEIKHFTMTRGQIPENAMSQNSCHKIAIMQPAEEGQSYTA